MAESTHLRIALAQIDPTVGDVEGNARLAADSIASAREAGAQLVVLPELCLSGYPPEDLLLRGDFLDAVRTALEALAADVSGIVALVGFPERAERHGSPAPNPIIDPLPPPAHNSLAVLADGEIASVYRKIHLPNYGVFDERRYFEPGDSPQLIEVDGVLVGLTICEDIWVPGTPESDEANAGARLIVNASASPYTRGKGPAREEMIADRALTTGAAFALCNTVGGQDELVFDGQSVVVSPAGETLARAAQFELELLICDLLLPAAASRRRQRRGRGGAPAKRRPARGPGRGARRRSPRRGARGLRGARPRRPRLRREERLRGRRPRPLGRDRLGPRRPGRRRRGRPRAAPLRRHALPPLQRGDPGRRARDRDQPRRRPGRDPDRRRDGGLRASARASASRGPSPGSPRRTCRPGSAATS